MADLIDFLVTGPGGNVVNLIGLVITIAGFVVTIINVRKSKTAAEQAREATLKVREDIQRIDMVSDLSKALTIMEEIRRLHRERTWIILPDRYSELKRLLISIKATNINLSAQQKVTIQATIQHFTTIASEIEKALLEKKEPNIPKLNTIIAKQVDELGEILVEVGKNIGV